MAQIQHAMNPFALMRRFTEEMDRLAQSRAKQPRSSEMACLKFPSLSPEQNVNGGRSPFTRPRARVSGG